MASIDTVVGPPGAIALADALKALGIPVSLLTDELSFAAAPGASSVTLQILVRGADGRFGPSNSLTRSGVVSGWVLR